MSPSPVLTIVLPPSVVGQSWRDAVEKAAADRHASVDVVTQCPDVSASGGALIIIEQPRTLWRSFQDQDRDAKPRDVLTKVSSLLAETSQAVANGADTRAAEALSHAMGELGSVSRAPAAIEAVDDPALDFYSNQPPAIGASAYWGVQHFSYPVGGGFDGGGPDMDLTGRFRILVHGPYIVLPPGLWQVEAQFEVDPERGVTRLRFEWGVGDDLDVASVQIDRPGVYSMALTRLWSVAGPAQLRIWSEHAAFQGHMRFKGCFIRRLPDPHPAVDAGSAAP